MIFYSRFARFVRTETERDDTQGRELLLLYVRSQTLPGTWYMLRLVPIQVRLQRPILLYYQVWYQVPGYLVRANVLLITRI